MTNALYAIAPGSLRIMRGGACVASISRGDMNPDDTADFAEKITAALNAYNPHLAPFADLPPVERRARVHDALDPVLRSLLASVATTEIATHIAKLVVEREPIPDELELISRILVKLAPDIPEASRSTETFVMYGRTMRRWVWSPRT